MGISLLLAIAPLMVNAAAMSAPCRDADTKLRTMELDYIRSWEDLFNKMETYNCPTKRLDTSGFMKVYHRTISDRDMYLTARARIQALSVHSPMKLIWRLERAALQGSMMEWHDQQSLAYHSTNLRDKMFVLLQLLESTQGENESIKHASIAAAIEAFYKPIKSDGNFKMIKAEVDLLSSLSLSWIYQAKLAAYERMMADWRSLKADITA